MQGNLKQNSSAQPLEILLVLNSDGKTGATGLSPVITLSKNGGAFAAPGGAVSEIGNGWYKIAGNSSDTSTLGPLLVHAAATGISDPADAVYNVVAYDPQQPPPSGAGPIAINQNTGGPDNLRYVDSSGNGISGASILIYQAADWPENPGNVQAAAATGLDGRWIAPAYVSRGTYVAVFTKAGADGPDVSAPFTV
jgi:hypothetical protein